MEEVEIWKDVAGFEGYYKISSFGRLKTLPRIADNGRCRRMLVEKIRNPGSNSDGYLQATLSNGKKSVCMKIHRLVCIAFLENPFGKETVNHKDGNKKNNRLSNLEWNTQQENLKHARHTGLSSRKLPGEPTAKLTDEQVYSIRNFKGIYSIPTLSKMFNVSKSSIHRVVNNKTWKNI